VGTTNADYELIVDDERSADLDRELVPMSSASLPSQFNLRIPIYVVAGRQAEPTRR
jgi:hypothetical protein